MLRAIVRSHGNFAARSPPSLGRPRGDFVDVLSFRLAEAVSGIFQRGSSIQRTVAMLKRTCLCQQAV